VTIDALYIDYLPAGALPLYASNADTYYHVSEDRSIMQSCRPRVLLPMGEYLDFEKAIQGLVRALDEISKSFGTLIFALRGMFMDEGRWIAEAAFGFVPDRMEGAPNLDGADASDLIWQACQELAGGPASSHPAILAAQARRREYAAQRLAEEAADEVSKATALELLEAHLTEEQRLEFRASRSFQVMLRDGRRFRLCAWLGHNVYLLNEEGLAVVEYCIITVLRVPIYDQLLAQKILLETLPDEFFRLANSFPFSQPLRDPRPPLFHAIAADHLQHD